MESRFFINTNDTFSTLSDEQLIEEIKKDNEKALEYLMDKYKSFVYSRAKSYFLNGGEKQDIIQEGLIGLFKAIKNYDINKQNSFKVFADLCIRRQIITAVKTSTRQKHMPLNSFISLSNNSDDDSNDRSLEEVLGASTDFDPSEVLENKETFLNIKSKITSVLSEFEQNVLDKHLCGYTYTQIASILEAEPKSVDNAIQRIKKKMHKHIYADKDLF